ncbi:PREDICTED: mesoderm induction early response protein 2 isoform X3 [Haliaeetus leucocephalus]|uniref:mesoderm induction early response protein 2 isoform X3 n=1 Tax=Haliaeetus leucocephalus TaxID=52644 RepID=UPI000522D4E4|nr:PREDICTED: mesoderm induction early response protein 2 isoform X3 [Haliaeetus albicilla]XP_010561429.1 PREDICTED: mesoderm induction early response protein 2 isoform X3 [Haliaeetus leucocephalus]
MSQPYFSLFLKASVGRQSPRVVPYPARSLCPGEPGLQSAAVVSMGSADHRLNLAEILSQNYGVREEREEDDTQEKQKSLEELEKSFSASQLVLYSVIVPFLMKLCPPLAQSSEMPFEELLALYGYEASDPISEQDSESNDITPNLPDMTLDKEQIAKDLLSGEEEEETQSSADDLTPSVTSHDASDLFPNQPGSNNFLADEDKEPCSSPCASSMAEDSEEDSIPSNECKKEIMVGPQYQATVPILHLNRHSEKVLFLLAYENEDQLLWDPNILPERDVEEFLYRAVKRRWDELSSSSLPEGEMVKDNEQALYELVKCNFNAEEALRRLRFNVKVIRDELCAWSEEECRNFEHGFRVHGKNFHLIQANKVRTRSVGECVEYYYMWKKSERYDYFTQQTRLGRKKDFTDNDLDGGEVENTSRSRSSPPIPSATSSLDSHFGQDQIAIESTEPLSVESTACSLGSISESGQGYECSTPSETNCSFDPTEETSSGTISASCTRHTVNPSESGLFALPLAGPGLAEKQETLQSSGETITMDFTLPADINEGLPLIAGPVDLDRDPEAVVTPAQVSLSVTDFGLIGIGDVNSFLTAHQACPAPVARSEPLSQ